MKDWNEITVSRIIIVIAILALVISLFTGCVGTYVLTDSEYSDARETHASVTYYDNQIYWGWDNGYYYYYGIPHHYPWYYYYNACPPSHYHTSSHIVITSTVNRPKPTWNKPRPNNTNIIVKPNNNRNNTKINVNKNRNTKHKVTVRKKR